MLESLTRLMWKAGLGESFLKRRKIFKKLEDMLGVIDHYSVLYERFSPSAPRQVKIYLALKKEKAVQKLNRKLKKNDFYQRFLGDFAEHAASVRFSEATVKNMQAAIETELKECAQFYMEYKAGFPDMEGQVHELRRKLRWLSIYAQSLEGAVKLQKASRKYSWEKTFVTPEIKKSEFMKLPRLEASHTGKRGATGLPRYIMLNEKAFAALCYVIQELGRIKDAGLSMEVLAKALRKTGLARGAEAMQLAEKQTGAKQSETQLLKEAHDLLKKFFIQHKIHEKLLAVSAGF